ncbi:MAG: MarR family transcriptional regulator [Firmicutes bacterium]|nr:MarR family transcriptional regulator [Bacillota bacterium]NLL87646.1 MarR family transcriptional regulator [Bacillota bacterium]
MHGQLPRRILDLLQEGKRNSEKLLRKALDHYQLTIPQIALIILLHENKEMSVTDLSQKMGLSKSTVSGIIDRLERIGIVKRKRSDQDRRVVTTVLTEQFQLRGSELERSFNDLLCEIFNTVSEQALMDIIKGLEMFNEIISTNIDSLSKRNQ